MHRKSFISDPISDAGMHVAVDTTALSPEMVMRIIGAANGVLGSIEAVATMPRLPDEVLPRVLAESAVILRAELERAGVVPPKLGRFGSGAA